MKNCRCNKYVMNTLLGIYSDATPKKPCPDYCLIAPDVESLPPPDECESLLAFVEDPNKPDIGGFFFDYEIGSWVPILELISVVYIDPMTVKGIKGSLLLEYEVLINGTSYSADQLLDGITFFPPLMTPIKLIYRNLETGCLLQGQTIDKNNKK